MPSSTAVVLGHRQQAEVARSYGVSESGNVGVQVEAAVFVGGVRDAAGAVVVPTSEHRGQRIFHRRSASMPEVTQVPR